MDHLPIILPAATFLLVAGFTGAVISLCADQDQRVRDRLRRLRDDNSTDVPLEGEGGWMQRCIVRIAAPFLARNSMRRSYLQGRLAAAGLSGPMAGHVFVACRIVLLAAAAGAVMGLAMTQALPTDWLLLAAGTIVCCAVLIPSCWLERRKTRRQAQLVRALPDFLDLLVTCVESGLSLEGSLKRVTSELRFVHPPLAGEMERVQYEMDLGATPEAALQHFAARCDLEPVRTLAGLVQQARRFGGSITDALRTHSDMLRDRREQLAEELAQKASVKILMPTLLLIFPAVFVVVAGPAVIQLSTKLVK